MDMLDPTLSAAPSQPGTDLNEATGTAPVAGIETPAEASEAAPEPQAEVEAEDMMSEGLSATAEAEEQREHTEESLLADAIALLEKDAAEIGNDEIRRLRQLFSMLHKNTGAAAEGEAQPVAAPSETEKSFNATIEQLRARKAEWAAAQEALKAANLERKNAIIAEIIALAEDTDNVNRTFPRYRELQDEFNAVGDVDPTEETSVWKRFQEARERYSDNLKINKELRDYDFKKNLAEKEAILTEVAELNAEEDVIAAYRKLQDMHNRWRRIGPVAKELRDEIWNRFREASAEINKRYQAFFEARKAQEAANEAAKTELCHQVESIDFSTLRTFASWDEATRRIQAMQEQWHGIGFAAKKVNRALFNRFRAACDAFFAAKSLYFKSTREEFAANLARKQALVTEAESLKDSTDWRKAGDRFMALQKEWREIGSVPKKHSEDLWKRFTAACDYFFGQRKKAGSGARREEQANLKAKREIVAALSALTAEGVTKGAAIAELKKLQDRWREIGHVPFREKDKLHDAYRAATDAVRDHFALAEAKARRERFEAGVAEIESDGNKLFRERERLLRVLESRRADLRTYENNLGFLSSKSKSGNNLLHDLERRIDRLKADITDLEEKIKLIDTKLA
ncbi:MAG: DUF349 domain-containing protein [Muribaculaceae bacterium]|nr:DUF349 domain-containing protein [Muribaculaceae bacterium]